MSFFFTLAPASSKTFTISVWPSHAASIKDVPPHDAAPHPVMRWSNGPRLSSLVLIKVSRFWFTYG